MTLPSCPLLFSKALLNELPTGILYVYSPYVNITQRSVRYLPRCLSHATSLFVGRLHHGLSSALRFTPSSTFLLTILLHALLSVLSSSFSVSLSVVSSFLKFAVDFAGFTISFITCLYICLSLVYSFTSARIVRVYMPPIHGLPWIYENTMISPRAFGNFSLSSYSQETPPSCCLQP